MEHHAARQKDAPHPLVLRMRENGFINNARLQFLLELNEEPPVGALSDIWPGTILEGARAVFAVFSVGEEGARRLAGPP